MVSKNIKNGDIQENIKYLSYSAKITQQQAKK